MEFDIISFVVRDEVVIVLQCLSKFVERVVFDVVNILVGDVLEGKGEEYGVSDEVGI